MKLRLLLFLLLILPMFNVNGEIKAYSSYIAGNFAVQAITASTHNNIKQAFESDFKVKASQIKTIECSFVQEKKMTALENKVSMDGTFYYDSKGNISLQYIQPEGFKITFSGDKFMIITAGKKTISNIKSNPMLKQMANMLSACMTGNIVIFEKAWDINYTQSKDEYTLRLKPFNKKAGEMMKEIVLSFVKKDMSLSKMQMVEKGGNVSTYKFYSKKFNVEINPTVFEIK